MLVETHKFNMLIHIATIAFILGIGIYLTYFKRNLKYRSKTLAKVIKYVKIEAEEFVLYLPVVQFKDYKDQLVEAIIAHQKSLRPKFKINTELSIRYSPLFPDVVIMDTKIRRLLVNNLIISSIVLLTIAFVYKNIVGI